LYFRDPDKDALELVVLQPDPDVQHILAQAEVS
jgi:hypothetical protein